jgi:tetratricopeptide (TPR) repeat protein
MMFFQEPQALSAFDSDWADTAEMDALLRSLAPERRPGPAGGGRAEAEGSCVPAPSVRDSEAGRQNERGMERRRDGDLHGALRDFDAALRLNPGLVVARNNCGVTRHELGDLEGALADFNEALRLDPRYADAYGNRAAVRTDLDDAEGAEADSRRALELAPDRASLHARRGALLHKQKNWLAARAEYDRALRLDAKLHWVYLLRGNTHYHTADWQDLCADYRTGFALAPVRCAGLLVRHLRAMLKADAAAALESAEQHVREDPDNPLTRAHRGLLLLLSGREAEARHDLDYCQRAFPESESYLDLILRQVHKQLG